MRLPTQRITITPSEYKLLQPGLDLLRGRFAEALMGSFPHRHFGFRVLNDAASVYKSKDFDEQMAPDFRMCSRSSMAFSLLVRFGSMSLNSWPQLSRSDFYA